MPRNRDCPDELRYLINFGTTTSLSTMVEAVSVINLEMRFKCLEKVGKYDK